MSISPDFGQELEAQRGFLFGLARRTVSTREDAEDLVQETYLRAIRRQDSQRPETNLQALLRRIQKNISIDLYRKSLTRPSIIPLEVVSVTARGEIASVVPEVETKTTQPSPEEIAQTRELRQELVGHLSALPQQYGTTVYLVDVLGFSYEETAQVSNVKLPTVGSRLNRGRRMLAERLAPKSDSPLL